MTDVPSTDWAELRRLADLIARGQTYSTAITPSTILALLDRAEKAEAEAKALRDALRPFAALNPSPFYAADGSEAEPYVVYLSDGSRTDFTGADLARVRALTDGDQS